MNGSIVALFTVVALALVIRVALLWRGLPAVWRGGHRVPPHLSRMQDVVPRSFPSFVLRNTAL